MRKLILYLTYIFINAIETINQLKLKHSVMKNPNKKVVIKEIKTGKIPDSVGFSGNGGGVLIKLTPEQYAKQFHTT